MATPIKTLQIDVDLTDKKITKIKDTEKNAVYDKAISLADTDLDTSKKMVNSVVKVMNDASKTDVETQIDVNAVNDALRNDALRNGGARKRRLSKRRPRGSNIKKFLVRNKSKKMRRGKYSRKAK